MAKRAKSINIDADPSGEFDFDAIHIAHPDTQRRRLADMTQFRGGNVAAARKAFEKTYGYKPTV